MPRPKIMKRLQKEQEAASEEMQNERAQSEGRSAWFKQPNVSRSRKWAVSQRIPKLNKR